MTYAIMLGVFVILLFLGAPIALSLGMSSLLAILYNGTGINVIAGQIYGGIGKYLLLAVPFFVLSGNIMAKAGISDRLIAFIDALLGHLRGGIAMVCVVVACFFGAISGSGAATVAALGVILIPAMIEREKFSDPFAHGVVAAASSIAVIIPPSISFVIYASLTGVSVGDIFVAGILPGVIMGVAMIIVVQIYAHKHHLKPAHPWKGWREVWRTFKSAFWGLLMPVIILGGIYGDVFSATEAAAVAAVYGLFVGTVIYKKLKWKDKGRILVNDKMETSVPGVYAIGDCVFGHAQLAHTASAMGEVAAENICGHEAHYCEKTNPTCVYMEPEAASVGLTEEQCKAQGIAYKVGKFPMSANGKALILNGGEGLVKIIAGAEYGEILGMHIIGPRATDLIAEGALAIGGEMTLDELIDTIHSHPTVTETMREAALNAEKRAIHTKN